MIKIDSFYMKRYRYIESKVIEKIYHITTKIHTSKDLLIR